MSSVAHLRKSLDVLDHLRIVVCGDAGFALGAVRHGQPADEIRHPDEGRALLIRILVEEMIDIPRLVADDEIVMVLANGVVQYHEIVDQDLIHAPDRLEGVQVVLRTLAFDVGRLIGQRSARRMNRLAAGREHRANRVLREPLDLEVRHECSQFGGDGGVALRVAESDRRGDEERALVPFYPRGLARRADGVANREIDRHGQPHVRQMTAPFE